MESNESLLLSLPPEIRDLIYELVFTVHENNGAPLSVGHRPNSAKNRKTYSVQSLVLTCSQIYNEACGIFYSVNHISLSIHRFNHFIRTMFAQRWSSITHITFYAKYNRFGKLRFIDDLTQLPNIETFGIDLVYNWYPSGPGAYSGMISSEDPDKAIRIKIAKLPKLQQVHVQIPHPGYAYQSTPAKQVVRRLHVKLQAVFDDAVMQEDSTSQAR